MKISRVPATATLALAIAGVLACRAAQAGETLDALATLAAIERGGAVAQTAPPAPTAATNAAPYRDRVLSSEQLQPLPPDEDELDLGDGRPYSLYAELLFGRDDRGGQRHDEQALSFGGHWDTVNFGSLSLDATLLHNDRDNGGADDGFLLDRGNLGGDSGGRVTLWQRGLHMPGGWRVDNGLGVLDSPALPMQRNQFRFFLPGLPFAGASSTWRNDLTGLQLQAALGRSGTYSGYRVTGFDIADGHVAALGAQWRWAPGWSGAAAFLGTQGERFVHGNRFGLPDGDSNALYAATAWQGARESVQVNLLGSEAEGIPTGTDGDARTRANGAWIDGNATRGRYQHSYGLFRLEPGLAWGAQPISNDAQGGYYRLGYQFARWSWNAGIDRIDSVSGNSFDGTYATGYARYQASSVLSYGGSLNLRHSDEDAWSAQWFVDRTTRLGQTRVQYDQSHGDGGDNWQFGIDHALPLQVGSRLSASLQHGRIGYDDGPATSTTTFALNGGRDLGDRVSVDANVRWTEGSGNEAQRGLDLNLGLDWRIAPRWSLSAGYYQNEGARRSPFVLDPLAPDPQFIELPRDRSLYVTLRYQRHGGRPQGVIGGAPGSASGRVTGTVYLDENADGVRSASEQPAANITVLLDGRYSVRTDNLGRFEFPRVASGQHTVTVVTDNLALPWFIDPADAQRRINVGLRSDEHVDVGARRTR